MPRYFYSERHAVVYRTDEAQAEPTDIVVVAANKRDALTLILQQKDKLAAASMVPNPLEAIVSLRCPFCKCRFSTVIIKKQQNIATCRSCGSKSVPFTNGNPRGWAMKEQAKKSKTLGEQANAAFFERKAPILPQPWRDFVIREAQQPAIRDLQGDVFAEVPTPSPEDQRRRDDRGRINPQDLSVRELANLSRAFLIYFNKDTLRWEYNDNKPAQF